MAEAITPEQVEAIVRDYVRTVPTALAVRSVMRMVAIGKKLDPSSTVLDVGCGDGCFGRLYPHTETMILDGIDLSADEAALARKTGAYRRVDVGDISQMMPQGPYDVALGNCSLEHVPDIHAALGNIRQALRPGGRLLMAVPAFGWARTLRSVQFLERYSNRLGMAAAGAMDGFFQHHHLYGYDTWSTLVEKSGFEVVSVEGLGAEYINWIFERELPLAFAEFVCKGALRHYPGLFRGLRRMPSRRALLEILEQPVPVNSPHRVEFILHAVRA